MEGTGYRHRKWEYCKLSRKFEAGLETVYLIRYIQLEIIVR